MDKEILLKIKSDLLNFVLSIGPKLIYAIVCLVIGIILIKILRRVLRGILNKSNVELSLRTFIESLSKFLLYGLLFFGRWQR